MQISTDIVGYAASGLVVRTFVMKTCGQSG